MIRFFRIYYCSAVVDADDMLIDGAWGTWEAVSFVSNFHIFKACSLVCVGPRVSSRSDHLWVSSERFWKRAECSKSIPPCSLTYVLKSLLVPHVVYDESVITFRVRLLVICLWFLCMTRSYRSLSLVDCALDNVVRLIGTMIYERKNLILAYENLRLVYFCTIHFIVSSNYF